MSEAELGGFDQSDLSDGPSEKNFRHLNLFFQLPLCYFQETFWQTSNNNDKARFMFITDLETDNAEKYWKNIRTYFKTYIIRHTRNNSEQ